MAETTWTTADLEALEKAIASGALSVQYADRRVQYRSLDEMLKIRDLMRKALGKTDPSGGRIFTKFGKGL